MFLAKCCNRVMVPKGEHHAIGKAESAVSELDKMTRATLHDEKICLLMCGTLWWNTWRYLIR
jgi:hypothetical protein